MNNEEVIRDIEDNDEFIVCKVCGKKMSIISPTHLKTHNMTIQEYKDKFPNAPLTASSMRNKIKNTKSIKSEIESSRYETDKTPIIDNDLAEKIRKQLEELSSIEVIPNKKNNYDVEFPVGISNKERIMLYLKTKFKDVQKDFFIEKITPGDYLEYKFVTDIVIPSLKIDIEFVNAFWHNSDTHVVKHARDKLLQDDGWTIIEVKSKTPNVNDMFDALQKYNII